MNNLIYRKLAALAAGFLLRAALSMTLILTVQNSFASDYEQKRIENLAGMPERHNGRVAYLTGCNNIVVSRNSKIRRLYVSVDTKEDDCERDFGNIVSNSARLREIRNYTVVDKPYESEIQKVGNIRVLRSRHGLRLFNQTLIRGEIQNRKGIEVGTVKISFTGDDDISIRNYTSVNGEVRSK